MGNVHPYPRYLSREHFLHRHPASVKKYGLLRTHLGCKSAIKRMVHLLLYDAEKLLTRGSIRLVPPTNKPFPCLPCCCPHPEQKNHFHGGAASPQVDFAVLLLLSHFSEPLGALMGGIWAWLLAAGTAPSSQHRWCCPPPIPWGLIHLCPQGRAIFALDPQG